MELTFINVFSISLFGSGLIFCVRILNKLKSKKCKCLIKVKKTIVITGATSGLGEACAIELAKRNCRVILGVRNIQLAEKVIHKIRKSNKNADVTMFPLDLSEVGSIKRFVQELGTEKVDVLINNAGVMAGHFRMIQCTQTEEDMAVNYLGHFYLTNLLLPNLGCLISNGDGPVTDSATSRVIFISSSLSKNGRLAIEKLDLSKDPYNPMQAYANSKFALNLFATELHRRYHHSNRNAGNINVMTMFTNGMVNTRLSRHILSTYSVCVQPLLRVCMYLLLRDSSDVCQSIVHCAISDELAQSSNELFANFRSIPWPDNMTESKTLAEELWMKSCEIVGLRNN